ncbi:MAG: glycoside hydrolase family 127 protein, partial [Planctomycetes bacterium]|nr:glycoside hydrolase family 127 protein [Planctomycetota bacterium]
MTAPRLTAALVILLYSAATAAAAGDPPERTEGGLGSVPAPGARGREASLSAPEPRGGEASLPAPERAADALAVEEKGALALDRIRYARFSFAGPIGERIERNIDRWILTAPVANPGMIEMLRQRDRRPAPQVVPWAGEFAGKYLISAVQALRMTERPEVERFVGSVVRDLISTQAEDGYLGPFPRAERLLGNWDLWGHYHVMLALLLWHERTGDAAALEAAIRAGDLICRTYVESARSIHDAGSHEMNMAVIHALGKLHRLTGKEIYLRQMREIEKDWERAGDYFRQGLAGIDFYRTPRPRWESLHDIQGLVELFRITGDERYRRAFVNLWRSIAERDRHNTGGFSSGEQAVGHPYSPAAIETCCTVAWMALTVDMLRLTGDPRAADELELSTWNAAAGAQHPSGRWWTYDTPMDGRREASAHTIVFQSRAGTPELNCCSVNAPRSLGMLSEWAVMRAPGGIAVNHYGPCRVSCALPGGARLILDQADPRTTYPRGGDVWIRVEPSAPSDFAILLRVPAWSRETEVRLNGSRVEGVRPGEYLAIDRTWRAGDEISLRLDLRLRIWVGDQDAAGRISIFRGPILLGYDQRWNAFDEDRIPSLDARKVEGSSVAPVDAGPPEAAPAAADGGPAVPRAASSAEPSSSARAAAVDEGAARSTPAVPRASSSAASAAEILAPWLLVDLEGADGRR